MPTKSGIFWVKWANENAPNSSDVEKLTEPFRTRAKAFIAALTNGDATVKVMATKRSERRAYLFHWSWLIALGKCKASEVNPLRPDVDIQWDHGNNAASRAGARDMVAGFGLAVPPASVNAPSLTSNHIQGLAIDMEITWPGTITVKNGDKQDVKVSFMPNVNDNVALHRLGESYGVKKLVTDAPHWSFDGR